MRKAITSSSLAFVARNVCGSLAVSRGDVTTAGREAGKGEDLLRSIRDGMPKEPELPSLPFPRGECRRTPSGTATSPAPGAHQRGERESLELCNFSFRNQE